VFNSEKKVKALIKRRMEKEFPLCYHFMPVQNGMGAPSLDFLYCIHGMFVAIEAKVLGKVMTPRQNITAKEITEAGGLTFLVDGPVALENAIGWIKTALLKCR
jgi:hypothetical protein